MREGRKWRLSLSLCLWNKDGGRKIKSRQSPTVLLYNDFFFFIMSTKWDKSKRFVWGDRSRSKRDNNFHWAEGFYLSSSALNNRVLQSLCCDVKLHLRSNKTCINNAFKTPLASSYFSDVETVAGTFTSPVKGWKWRCVYFTRKNLLSNEVICREKNKQILLKEIGLGQFNKKKIINNLNNMSTWGEIYKLMGSRWKQR